MKALIALIFAFAASSASAYTSCTRYGNTTTCWGSGGTVTCSTYGNTTTCY